LPLCRALPDIYTALLAPLRIITGSEVLDKSDSNFASQDSGKCPHTLGDLIRALAQEVEQVSIGMSAKGAIPNLETVLIIRAVNSLSVIVFKESQR
jgi:hypothetical protein